MSTQVKFQVLFEQEAEAFLAGLLNACRERVLKDIRLAQTPGNRKRVLAKLRDLIWELRSRCQRGQVRFLCYWDRSRSKERHLICTHGIIKKTGPVPGKKIKRAEQLRRRRLGLP